MREVVGRGVKVFLDLKLHDIPNTVQNAVREVEKLNVAMLTVHASGGAPCSAPPPRTSCSFSASRCLTSLDDAAIREIGFASDVMTLVPKLARLAQQSGLRGVVASPLEIRAIREVCGGSLTIVAPGVRPAGVRSRRSGAHADAARGHCRRRRLLVIGRPITEKRTAARRRFRSSKRWREALVAGGSAAVRAIRARTVEEHALARELASIAECIGADRAKHMFPARRAVEVHRHAPRVDRCAR